MTIARTARPLQIAARWLIAGLLAVALFAAAGARSTPVDAAVWCGGVYTTYCPLVGYASYYPGYVGYNGYGYAPYVAYRQYTDNRTNCPNGQVTQTPGGYFCTNYGVQAFVVNGNAPLVYAGGFYPGYAGYYPGYRGYYPYLVYRP
jgi:hypothetical protein